MYYKMYCFMMDLKEDFDKWLKYRKKVKIAVRYYRKCKKCGDRYLMHKYARDVYENVRNLNYIGRFRWLTGFYIMNHDRYIRECVWSIDSFYQV